MKLVVYRTGEAPIVLEAWRIGVTCGQDCFELREQNGLLVRLEEHDGGIAADIAMFPFGGNAVRLKGGLR